MGTGDQKEEDPAGRFQAYFSRDDQRVYWVDSTTGQVVRSWECRSAFEPGTNEEGQSRESLPSGSYTLTADEPGVPNGPANGNFYIHTGDPRYRDIHGGGSGLIDSYAPRQGWVPTFGCLRMQNEDGQEWSRLIREQGKAPLFVMEGPVRIGALD